MRVNLLKNKKRKRKRFYVNWLRVIATCLICVLILTGAYKYWVLRKRIEILENEHRALDRELTTYMPEQKEYQSLEKEIEELNEFVDVREVKAEPWGEALLNFGYMIPKNIMLEKIQMEQEQVTLAGLTESEDRLIEFLNILNNSSLFNKVDLEDIDKEEDVIFTIILNLETGG